MSDDEAKRLEALDVAYDEQAAVLEDEDSDDDAIAAAEAELDRIEQESRAIRDRPQVLAPDLCAQAGMILTLGRDGAPVLQPVYYTERSVEAASTVDDSLEPVCETTGNTARRSVLSKRLVDELAMQRRDVLALHVASDPGLALDVLVFVLADTDRSDWHSRSPSTLRGGVPNGPIMGFEPADAPATAALAELRSSLDETWRSGETMAARFELFRALDDEARAGWLGLMVGRTLEASLNLDGDRRIAFLDHLGGLVGIDIARWWRPTAANYFDRVSKQVILDALTDIGGLELSSRFASVKKRDLAMSAERVFAGTAITEVDVRERALAWVPGVMRFAPIDSCDGDVSETDAAPEVGTQIAELDGDEVRAPESRAA
jgi:ParB family chromosome partitioning protein